MTPADQLDREPGTIEVELQRLHARIEQLERERDGAESFAALAAHELMAPLVLTEACVAYAGERLGDGQLPELMQALTVLGRGAGRTRRLVEALLHEARASGRPLRRDRVDLGPLAQECIELLAPEVRARSARIAIGPLPVVPGQSELLGGVLTNLLMNALKFNPRDGGAIEVGAERDAGMWTISVTSEGPVVPAEDRERIFEPYHRGSGERRTRGAGLGLAISRRIVERHGGRIGVAEAPLGNRFHFTLPA
jgi:signal transduction histidine kinase